VLRAGLDGGIPGVGLGVDLYSLEIKVDFEGTAVISPFPFRFDILPSGLEPAIIDTIMTRNLKAPALVLKMNPVGKTIEVCRCW
jgi:hypothetical protein